MEIYFTIRHMVTLVILCGDTWSVIPDPNYIMEKIRDLERMNVPEQFLDEEGLYQFRRYAENFKLDWNSQRDYHDLPAERRCFDPHTGEAKPEFIPVGD